MQSPVADELAEAPIGRRLNGILSPILQSRIIISIWKVRLADRLKVMIDTNIILDVQQKREPFFYASAKILASAETGKVKGYIAAQTTTTLF